MCLYPSPALDEHYTELQELNNQRTVDKLEKPVQPVGGA